MKNARRDAARVLLRYSFFIVHISFVIDLAAAAQPDEQGLAEQQAFRAAVGRVAPSVVRIETIGGLERIGGLLFGTGPTTGLVVAPDGYIVSSAFNFLHRPASILVQPADGVRKPARLVATDHNRMIVLLKIEPDKPLPVPEIAPLAGLRVGQWTIAVGRTFEGREPNMAVGVLSATNRIWGKAIQTDAAVSPNNYGGPLVDIEGRVLGVLVPLSPMETAEVAGVEWYDSGIGFAVPAQTILELLPRLKQGKDLQPGRLGISLPLATLYTADSVIPTVRPQSPAHKAGFRGGDRIVAMDGRKIGLAVEVKQELSRRYAGDKVRITAARGKERIEREVELVAKLDPYRQPFLGVLPMRSRTGDKAPGASRIRVRYVFPGSPAAEAGLQPGDALTAVGGTKVEEVPQVRSRLTELQPGDRIPVEFLRGSESRRAEVTLADLPEGTPAGPLPPAREPGKPVEGKRPHVGAIQVEAPDLAGGTACYVPENYDPAVPHGILFWLPPPGEIKPREILARWKAHCDRDGLILVVPKSSGPVRWQRPEARIIPPLAAQVAAQYTVDANRIVVYGRLTAGAVAFAAAFRYPQLVRAVAVLDAPAEGQIPDNDPGHRLAFYLGWATKAAMAGAVRETAGTLRQMRYPVTEKDLGPQSRELSTEELAELARWIDTLDRI